MSDASTSVMWKFRPYTAHAAKYATTSRLPGVGVVPVSSPGVVPVSFAASSPGIEPVSLFPDTPLSGSVPASSAAGVKSPPSSSFEGPEPAVSAVHAESEGARSARQRSAVRVEVMTSA